MSLKTDMVSASQVIDVRPTSWGCLNVPCTDLNSAINAIVAKLCEGEQDYSSLDFGCVVPGETLSEVLQNILNEIQCGDGGGGNPPVVQNATVTGLTPCTSDNWNCAEVDSCLTFDNPCNPGEVTVKLVLQALINRLVAYGTVIKSQCAQLSSLQTQINTLSLVVTNIQSSCCP
jgi:hypothetical protein